MQMLKRWFDFSKEMLLFCILYMIFEAQSKVPQILQKKPGGSYSTTFRVFEVLISKLKEKRTKIMCQNLSTGRIVGNVEIIVLFVFFTTITSKYVYQLSEKTLFLSVFDFLGLRQSLETLIFKILDTFVFVQRFLELWDLLFIKFGKSSITRRYHE